MARRSPSSRWMTRFSGLAPESGAQHSLASGAGAVSVLLENMAPEQVGEWVVRAAELQGASPRRCLLEASGGINVDTVAAYAAAGVDLVSSGTLTNSAPALDIGLDIVT